MIVLLALKICFPDTEIVTSRSLRRTTGASCGSKNSNLMDIIEALSKEPYGRSYWKDNKGGHASWLFLKVTALWRGPCPLPPYSWMGFTHFLISSPG